MQRILALPRVHALRFPARLSHASPPVQHPRHRLRLRLRHRRPRRNLLGKPVTSDDRDGDGRYAELRTAADEPIILLQKVEHASRVHLDIETNDLEAEAARLEQLGAQRVARAGGRCWVMQAPSDHRYCVVQPPRETFGPHLNRWD